MTSWNYSVGFNIVKMQNLNTDKCYLCLETASKKRAIEKSDLGIEYGSF